MSSETPHKAHMIRCLQSAVGLYEWSALKINIKTLITGSDPVKWT
jgi:hypothetical protein